MNGSVVLVVVCLVVCLVVRSVVWVGRKVWWVLWCWGVEWVLWVGSLLPPSGVDSVVGSLVITRKMKKGKITVVRYQYNCPKNNP